MSTKQLILDTIKKEGYLSINAFSKMSSLSLRTINKHFKELLDKNLIYISYR